MKKIKTYSELKKVIEQIKQKLPDAPFRNMGIDEYGHFFNNEDYFAPEEALKVGKFLVEFYGEDK